MVQANPVRLIVIAKNIYFFIPVIHLNATVDFWINALPITGRYRTIGSVALVFFHFNINDAGIARCVIFGRWVGYNIYLFDSR